jgi:hypothetical protein
MLLSLGGHSYEIVRTHLQHVVTATAMNLCRLYDWLQGIAPHATPLSHFARLMKEAA